MDNRQPGTGAASLQDQVLAVQSAGAADGPWHRQCQLAVAEAKRLLRLAGPIIFSCLLTNLINVASIMVVGHLGEVPLAGASLASSFANVTGYNVLTGMAMALDTLCGQAFGAGQYRLLSTYKQRAMVLLALTCIPIVVVWANAEKILVLLGQDHAIAAVAGEYARWLIPSLVLYVPLQCHVRFLQAQSLVLPVTASSGAAVLCHVPLCWAMVYKAGMGANGAALSNTISYGVNVALLALYVRLSSSCKNTWTGFSGEAFRELRQFAKLALPSAMMIWWAISLLVNNLEWFSFEILVILSGLLPNPQLETSALSICLNIGALLYMIPLGLSFSTSIVVSNELGAGKPQSAKLAACVVMYMAFSGGLVIALTMILLRRVWGYMYSNNQEVVSYIARILPILGISLFVDGLHSSLSGVLTGCGKQKIGAGVNLGAFYLFGIPIAAVLAFVFHLNGMGLWLGIVCGSFVKLVLLLCITWCTPQLHIYQALQLGLIGSALEAKDMVLSSSPAEA